MSSASNVGQNIRRLRNDLGLSPEGLAYKADVALRTVERTELGLTVPRRATLRAIAAALGVDAADLREPEPERQAA